MNIPEVIVCKKKIENRAELSVLANIQKNGGKTDPCGVHYEERNQSYRQTNKHTMGNEWNRKYCEQTEGNKTRAYGTL